MRINLDLCCKYRLNFATNYVFTTEPKLLINTKSGRVIKQIMKGSTIGYIINSKFYSLNKLREHLELIPIKEITPF
jgi:hypothetical protein